MGSERAVGAVGAGRGFEKSIFSARLQYSVKFKLGEIKEIIIPEIEPVMVLFRNIDRWKDA